MGTSSPRAPTRERGVVGPFRWPLLVAATALLAGAFALPAAAVRSTSPPLPFLVEAVQAGPDRVYDSLAADQRTVYAITVYAGVIDQRQSLSGVQAPAVTPTFHWSFAPPSDDPGCTAFAQKPANASAGPGPEPVAAQDLSYPPFAKLTLDLQKQAGSSALKYFKFKREFDSTATWTYGAGHDGCTTDPSPLTGVATVTISMGSLTCTSSFTGHVQDLRARPAQSPVHCTGTEPGTSATPTPSTGSKASAAGTKLADELLRNAALDSLTLSLRKLPALMKKPLLRKAVFTHFTAATQAKIDRKLKQEKAAAAERAKTHARLQHEVRNASKKLWEARTQLESYKDLCNRYVDAYDTLGKFEVTVSAALASVPGGALFLPLTAGMGGASQIAGREWAQNADDPPDRHYKALVQPKPPRFATLSAGGLSSGLADAATTFLADDAKAVGLVTAFRRSFERAQGAAAAGNRVWTPRQLDAAASFAASAAAALAALPADLTALRQAVAAAGDPLASADSVAAAKLGNAAAPGRLLPTLAADTTRAAAALRTLATRLKALAAT